MFSFFEGIAAFISTIVNFVVNMFGLLVEILLSMVRAVTWLFACLAYLPPWLVGFVVVPISMAVIFQILNKGG